MRLAFVVLLAVASLVSACSNKLPDGFFACDPSDPGSCPDGYFCQIRGNISDWRCYQGGTEGVCGDGVLNPGEDCERTYDGTGTCQERGYWAGELTCRDDCRVSEDTCIGLVKISAGDHHACALDNHGSIWCWGTNHLGQLGTTVEHEPMGSARYLGSSVPAIVALPYAAVELGVGFDHGCAVDEHGGVWCWGVNQYHELGDGTAEISRSLPVQNTMSEPAERVTAGRFHSCALTVEGVAQCWGAGFVGQLGNGLLSDRPTPTPVSFSGTFVDLQAGQGQTCGLDPAGQLWCWGLGKYGSLGNGETADTPTPSAVLGDHVFTMFTVRHNHVCALDPAGQAWCWGSNAYGQLGDDTTVDRSTPQAVLGGHTFVSIAAGGHSTIAIDDAGEVWAWGSGPLGDGNVVDSATPIRVQLVAVDVSVFAGIGSLYALIERGRALAWGWNGAGSLAQPVESAHPRQVLGDTPFQMAGSGILHSCGIALDGSARCWGWGNLGQLGFGDYSDSYRPRPVVGGRSFFAIGVGYGHTCGLALDGSAWCWGTNVLGQLGDGQSSPDSTSPQEVQGGRQYEGLAIGEDHSCTIDASHVLYCWGWNENGQIGIGGGADVLVPTAVGGALQGRQMESVTAGARHTCALDDEQHPWCWGHNELGQLGDGTLWERPEPVAVAGNHEFVSISAGYLHTCGVNAAGEAWCWGLNLAAQLGTGAVNVYETVPHRVYGDTIYSSLACGVDHTCGLAADGSLWCWGDNTFGQLGTGTMESSIVPTPVASAHSFMALFSGEQHVCAIDIEDRLWCWGSNDYGQAGVDDFIPLPQEIQTP